MEKLKCKTCGEFKELSKMRKDNRIKCGYLKECKACRSKRRYVNGEYDRERIRKHEYKTNSDAYYTEKTLIRVANAMNCEYCGDELNRIHGDANQITMDHIYYAGSEYGGHNVDDNIAVCCRQCNGKKGQSHIYDFYQSFDRFTPELWSAFIKRWIGDMLNRPITDDDVEVMTENLREESDELREREKATAS